MVIAALPGSGVPRPKASVTIAAMPPHAPRSKGPVRAPGGIGDQRERHAAAGGGDQAGSALRANARTAGPGDLTDAPGEDLGPRDGRDDAAPGGEGTALPLLTHGRLDRSRDV